MPGAGRLNTMPFHKMPENPLKPGLWEDFSCGMTQRVLFLPCSEVKNA
jgi:hypothetical protein